MFKYKIGTRVIELDEQLGEINNKSKFMIPEGSIDCVSHYRSPNEADANVAGAQKSNLYTKLSINSRTYVGTPVPAFINTQSGRFVPKNVSDRELIYYALYIKKDVTPGALIKYTTAKGSKITFFKVKTSGLIR